MTACIPLECKLKMNIWLVNNLLIFFLTQQKTVFENRACRGHISTTRKVSCRKFGAGLCFEMAFIFIAAFDFRNGENTKNQLQRKPDQNYSNAVYHVAEIMIH